MLTMTYPLVQDPKLLVAVLENIFLGITNVIGSLLYFERMNKRIPPFHNTFESKFNTFKMRCVDRYGINREYLKFISEIMEIIFENRKSPVTFSRKNNFVICTDNYRIKTLTYSEIRGFLEKAKVFIQEICSIIEKNERGIGKL